MKKGKLLLSLVTAWLMIMCMPILAHASAYEGDKEKDVENDEFTVTVETGLDGVAVEGKAMPITVTIGNTGKDFSGVVRVIIPATYEQKSLAYEKTITIPSGGEKSISMLLSDIDSVSYLRVELENERGKILYSKQETFSSLVLGQSAVVGILSNDYSGLNYFDGVSISTYSGVVSSKIIRLTADNIPETSEGLSLCHYIIIDNYNTSQLSEEQRNAIVNWVADGGMLIFGTGSKASNTLEGFQNSVAPISVTGLGKQNVQVPGAAVTEPKAVDIANIEANGWQDIQSNIAFGAPAYQTGYGNGTVLVLSYDLAMEPIVSWSEVNKDLAINILENAGTESIYDFMIYGDTYGSSYDEWYLEEAVGGVDRNKVPNALLYAGVFLVYVICIGPVMYLVLKAKDKREKMWIVMPAIALLFTIVVYATSMIYRINKPFIDAISIVEFNNGSVNTKTYMTVQSPKGKEYSIDFAEGYRNMKPWNDYDYDYSQVGLTNYQYAVRQEGNAVQLDVEAGMAFSQQNLMSQKEEYREGVALQTNLNCSLSGFEGTVTNNTGHDLTNVVICYSAWYVYVGTMKNGETATIDMTQNQLISGVSYDLDEWMETVPSEFVFNKSEEYRVLLDNQNIYDVMESKAYDLDMNQGMVFGMIDNYEDELVQGNNTKVYSAAVAVSYFHQVVDEYQNYTFFMDDINERMVGGINLGYGSQYPQGFDYFYDIDDLDMYGEPEMEVLYDFSTLNLAGAQLMCVDTYTYSSMDEDERGSYSYGEVYTEVQLFNYTTQAYENVFTDGNVVDIAPYVNEQGWMQVRYYTDDPDPWGYYAPQIRLIGGEK